MANEIKVQITQISATTSEASMGAHRVLVDRPVEKNGTDLGPMGGQLFLASVGGCFMSNLLAANKARGSEISNVQTEVTGVMSAEAPVRFTSVELSVTADGDRELLEKLVEQLLQLAAHHIWVFPVVGRAGTVFGKRADESSIFYTRNIAGIGACQKTSRPQFLVELGEGAALDHLAAELVILGLGTVYPVNGIRFSKFGGFFDPPN